MIVAARQKYQMALNFLFFHEFSPKKDKIRESIAAVSLIVSAKAIRTSAGAIRMSADYLIVFFACLILPLLQQASSKDLLTPWWISTDSQSLENKKYIDRRRLFKSLSQPFGKPYLLNFSESHYSLKRKDPTFSISSFLRGKSCKRGEEKHKFASSFQRGNNI